MPSDGYGIDWTIQQYKKNANNKTFFLLNLINDENVRSEYENNTKQRKINNKQPTKQNFSPKIPGCSGSIKADVYNPCQLL